MGRVQAHRRGWSTYLLLGFMGILGAISARGAESPALGEIIFGPEESESLVDDADTVRRFVVVSEEGSRLYYLRVEAPERLVLSGPDGRVIPLPFDLDTLLSGDGSTLLQFGDVKSPAGHYARLNLYWIDNLGSVTSEVLDQHDGMSRVAMSVDGFTAVGGPLEHGGSEPLVWLYTPRGEALWRQSLGPSRRLDQLHVARGGAMVVALHSDYEDWLADHRIQLLAEGSEDSLDHGLGIVQKIVLVGAGDHAFIQGYEAYGVADLASRRMLWSSTGKVRMISPQGAELGPEGQILFLLLAVEDTNDTGLYHWRVRALELASGAVLGETSTTHAHPTTWEAVWEQITGEELKILTDRARLTFSWGR